MKNKSLEKYKLYPDEYNLFLYREKDSENLYFIYSLTDLQACINSSVTKIKAIYLSKVLEESEFPFITVLHGNTTLTLILNDNLRATICETIRRYYNIKD